MKQRENRLGIDIGRVIIAPGLVQGRADTSFLQGSEEDAMRTPPAHQSFEAIARLRAMFGGRVWLISKAGPRIENRTRHWLDHHRFFVRTGIESSQLRFCRERRQKADHCRALGITHFIDDRLDVLHHMRGVTRHLFLFGPQARPTPPASWFTPVEDWPAAIKAVIDTIE